MSADLQPDELTERLAALGRRPVDPALQSEHLTALAGVRSSSAFRASLAGRLKVAAGVMAGFLIGATGLASAGALGPVQGIAATAIEKATPLNGLPDSASDKAKAKGHGNAAKDKAKGGDEAAGTGGEKIWGATYGCPEATEFKNRGQFLKAAKDEKLTGPLAEMTFAEARQTDCGKGIEALTEAGDDQSAEAPEAPADDAAEENDGRNGAGNGGSGGKGNADDAGPPDETDDAAEPGKPSDTGAKPETVPAPPAQEKAPDNAKLPPAAAPGAAADDRPAPEAADGDGSAPDDAADATSGDAGTADDSDV